MKSHCRFCGEQKNIENLIDFSVDEKILQDFTFINLKLDLPKTACQHCYNSAQGCYNFFEKIKQTQDYLTSIYVNRNSSTPLLETHEIKMENDNNFEAEPVSSPGINCTSMEEKHYITLKSINYSDEHLDRETTSGWNNLKKPIKLNKKQVNSKLINNFNETDLQVSCSPKIKSMENKGEWSWSDYNWTCVHCQAKFNSMDAVRDHSKVIHAMCFGFQCDYCTELFNHFNLFIQHVRQHEESLRLYCQFCNVKSSTSDEALTHSLNHWTTSHICAVCGEILPSKSALDRHKRVYKKVSLPQRCYKKKPKRVESDISWAEYEWCCQDCSVTVPDISSLRAHTRDAHGKCFAMKCADCYTLTTNYKQFVDHVTAHRSCLKNFCPHCNEKLNPSDLQKHISTHISGVKAPCLGCGEVFPDSASLTQHKTLYETPRMRGSSDTNSLTCGVCLKVFQNAFQLKNHKVTHKEDRERDQICHSCGKAFFDAKTLANHIRTHLAKDETCQICHKSFLTKQRLKAHISTHLELKQFKCDECGKRFRRKSQLRLHLASHSAALPEQCGACGKRFRLLSYLKIHERQHTGIRPYSCEVCSETFNHWGNCNRHMIRKHGVTFAKTKITARGKLDVNRQTGEAKKIALEGKADWCREMLLPKKRGRKKKAGT